MRKVSTCLDGNKTFIGRISWKENQGFSCEARALLSASHRARKEWRCSSSIFLPSLCIQHTRGEYQRRVPAHYILLGKAIARYTKCPDLDGFMRRTRTTHHAPNTNKLNIKDTTHNKCTHRQSPSQCLYNTRTYVKLKKWCYVVGWCSFLRCLRIYLSTMSFVKVLPTTPLVKIQAGHFS